MEVFYFLHRFFKVGREFQQFYQATLWGLYLTNTLCEIVPLDLVNCFGKNVSQLKLVGNRKSIVPVWILYNFYITPPPLPPQVVVLLGSLRVCQQQRWRVTAPLTCHLVVNSVWSIRNTLCCPKWHSHILFMYSQTTLSQMLLGKKLCVI